MAQLIIKRRRKTEKPEPAPDARCVTCNHPYDIHRGKKGCIFFDAHGPVWKPCPCNHFVEAAQ